MILALAVAFSLACVLASARRAEYVVRLTAIDVGGVALSLRKARSELPEAPLEALEAAFADLPDARWEREVVAAVRAREDARAALLGEAMTELDFAGRRWNNVPRVCASLASSFGFLLATMSLRVGLSGLVGTLDDATVLSVNGAILDALDVAAVGLAGAAACVAVHYWARGAVGRQMAGADQLVDFLEQLAEAEATPLDGAGGHASVEMPFSAEVLSS